MELERLIFHKLALKAVPNDDGLVYTLKFSVWFTTLGKRPTWLPLLAKSSTRYQSPFCSQHEALLTPTGQGNLSPLTSVPGVCPELQSTLTASNCSWRAGLACLCLFPVTFSVPVASLKPSQEFSNFCSKSPHHGCCSLHQTFQSVEMQVSWAGWIPFCSQSSFPQLREAQP